MTRKFESTCEHGAKVITELKEPVTVEILLDEEDEDAIEYDVWLVSGEDHMLDCILTTNCQEHAELVAEAVDVICDADQERIIEFLKHREGWTEIAEVPAIN